MCTSEEGQEGGAGKPVNNTAIRRRGVFSCLSRPQPSMASPVRSLCLSCKAWNLQLPLGQMVPQCYFRTCPRTHPCFSIPTTTVLAEFHHHLLPGLLTGLESHPICPPCSSQGFFPALHLRWLPMASRIKSSYWKPSLPQLQRIGSHPPPPQCACPIRTPPWPLRVSLRTPTSSLSSSLWLSQAPRHSEPTMAGPPTTTVLVTVFLGCLSFRPFALVGWVLAILVSLYGDCPAPGTG